MEGRRLGLTVTDAWAGRTVDWLLRNRLGLSGTVVKRAKRQADGILLDGLPVTVRERARAGQVLSVAVWNESQRVRPEAGPLEILYEDGDVAVLHKPAGLAVHPGPGEPGGTLANFFLAHCAAQGVAAGFHPASRLDRGTSGLLAVALHPHAQERLKEQLRTRRFSRGYLAVCEGRLPERAGVIDAPIGRAEGSALRRAVMPDGKRAVTRYEVLHEEEGRALVRLALETGRTHQIRVHLAHIGAPLTGDFLYGVEDRTLIARPALHAWRLRLAHPLTGAALEFTAPPPADFAALLPGADWDRLLATR